MDHDSSWDPAEATRALEELYASLPRLACRQLCGDTCGPITMSALEWTRLTAAHGERACGDDLVCPYLERESGRCGAYEVRPLACRLGGATATLRCAFGCEPDRLLTEAEFEDLVARVEAISGGEPRSVWAGWTRALEAARAYSLRAER